ncbi:MAG: hypothetical protein KC466_16410, partial [Myxococcales bacterium]|nr:hypothetical protein [Myxococcales bacterium]
ADFCERVEGRKVNRKVLESLIKSGAFDSIHPNRAQAMVAVDGALELGAKSQRDRESGQLSIFGAMGDGAASMVADFVMPETPEWKEAERLRFEKETLGFYITGHPLSKFAGAIGAVSNVTTRRLREKAQDSVVKLAAVIAAQRDRTSKKGDKMATLTLEDQEGTVEAVVFPKAYEKVRHVLGEDVPVLVEGKVELGEETARLIVDGMVPLADAIESTAATVVLRVDGDRLDATKFAGLSAVLSAHQGPAPVFLRLVLGGRPAAEIDLGAERRVSPTPAFTDAVEEILGHASVELRKH